MKPENIATAININHKWMVWKPKKGKYAGMTKYICLLSSIRCGWGKDSIQCIIAGYKNGGKPHLSLNSITLYQLENNTKPLNDRVIQELFEEMFKEYKKLWQEKQIIKKTKALLTQ